MKFQTLTETLTLNTVINLFRSQWWSTIKPSLMQMGQYSLDMVERALLWLYEYWLWFWLWRQQQQNLSFHITLWFMMRHQSIPSLVTNGCNVHKIFSGQNLDIWTGCRPPPPPPQHFNGGYNKSKEHTVRREWPLLEQQSMLWDASRLLQQLLQLHLRRLLWQLLLLLLFLGSVLLPAVQLLQNQSKSKTSMQCYDKLQSMLSARH